MTEHLTDEAYFEDGLFIGGMRVGDRPEENDAAPATEPPGSVEVQVAPVGRVVGDWTIDAADLLAEPDPGPTPWLVEGLMVDQAIVACVGRWKTTKSYGMLDLEISIATGRPAFGRLEKGGWYHRRGARYRRRGTTAFRRGAGAARRARRGDGVVTERPSPADRLGVPNAVLSRTDLPSSATSAAPSTRSSAPARSSASLAIPDRSSASATSRRSWKTTPTEASASGSHATYDRRVVDYGDHPHLVRLRWPVGRCRNHRACRP